METARADDEGGEGLVPSVVCTQPQSEQDRRRNRRRRRCRSSPARKHDRRRRNCCCRRTRSRQTPEQQVNPLAQSGTVSQAEPTPSGVAAQVPLTHIPLQADSRR